MYKNDGINKRYSEGYKLKILAELSTGKYNKTELGRLYGVAVSGTASEGAMLQLVGGVPTWVAAVVGDFRDGGVVFWVDPADNTKGLVVDVNDLSTSAVWGCNGTGITGADGTTIGTGAQNTLDIEAGCTTGGTAADLCANSTVGGFNDWFLPSKDELNEIYQNKATINATATTNIGIII